MMTQRERFESYFALPGAKHPEEQVIILAAADAYDSAIRSGRITSKEVKIIVAAASSRHSRIWMNSHTLLAFAGERWRNAAEAIREMSHNSNAHVRFNAICCLSRQTPQDIIDTVLKSGLGDRSGRVRRKASDEAFHLRQVRLIPDIEAALTVERNENIAKSMRFSLGFLRDGYNLEPRSDGLYWVAVRLSNGGTGEYITDEELRTKGIGEIVSEIRKRCGCRDLVQN